jgi:hypothetical protein
MGTGLMRGRVYRAKLEHVDAPKYYLVVSNNRRNGALAQGEVFTGWVSCDDVETLWADEVQQDLGALSPLMMRRVEDGLRAAFDITR